MIIHVTYEENKFYEAGVIMKDNTVHCRNTDYCKIETTVIMILNLITKAINYFTFYKL